MGLGRPSETIGVSEQKNPGDPTSRKDMSCHDETVTAVVSDPATQNIASPRNSPFPGKDLIGRPTGIFHEELLRNPEFLYGTAVHRLHFVYAADLHRIPLHPACAAACCGTTSEFLYSVMEAPSSV